MFQPLRETSLSDYVNGIYLAILIDTFGDILNYSLKPTEKLMKNWKKKMINLSAHTISTVPNIRTIYFSFKS